MNIELVLTREEVEKNIPYQMICTTRYSSVWESRRRKDLWNEWFDDKGKREAEKLFKQAHQWYLKTGVPNSVGMTLDTYWLWGKIADFCYSI